LLVLLKGLPSFVLGKLAGVIVMGGREPEVIIIMVRRGLRLRLRLSVETLNTRLGMQLDFLADQVFQQRGELEEDIAIILDMFEKLKLSG
jgi:hypothetical protein